MIIITIFICGCCHKAPIEKPRDDFESLMGKDLPQWKFIQTKEDFQNLEFFKRVYETNISYLTEAQNVYKIPKKIHFIWIGPKPFPRESIENVRTWIAHHPGWTLKFWTDRRRALPHPDMELSLISDLKLSKVESLYHLSDNFGEKSDLLRLEILFQEGGIYADHDVKCFKSFEKLNQTFDFYCGMEVPYATCLRSSVYPTNNLLGSKPGHILLNECMNWLVQHWEEMEKKYPGKDFDAVITRIAHRTFSALGENFKLFANQENNVDIAFPSYYFNSPKEEWALYAQHQYKGTWFDKETDFEKKARKRLMMLSKKTNKILLALGVLAGLNFLGFCILAYMIHKRVSWNR